MSFVTSKRHLDANDDEEGMDLIEADLKKRRMPGGEDIGSGLVDMIKKLDDDLNGTSLEDALRNLASTLENNFDPYEAQIIHILYECAAYLPEKITIFSTLVGILNSRSSEFGKKLISHFVDELHNTIKSEQYDITVRIITFLCDLGNSYVIALNSIINLLEDFTDLAVEDNIKSDFFIYTVLHSLPWIGCALNGKLSGRFDTILNKISIYLGKRKKNHTKILQVWSSSEFPQQDYLDSLWTKLQTLKESSWLEKHILRTYMHFTTLTDSVQHELPRLDQGVLESSENYPLPRVVFRLFQQSDCQENEVELPADDAIERFLVEEDLNWIIDNNYTDWKLCAHALLNYHRKDTIPLDYAIIETIFGQLFRLPSSPHLELFYGALLIELCRSQSNSMPQVLALAAEMLFQRIDTMQPICIDRFVDWFSYHLSNFEYRWSWTDWADCIELDSLHPKRIFVREVIEKCLRLSYHKKLFEFLPREFGTLIPDEPLINYVLDDENHPAFAKAEQFRELILQKKSDEDILQALEDKGDLFDLGQSYSQESVAIFFSVLLKFASKTLTHSFAALTRYHKTLSSLTLNNEEMQSVILRTLYDSWSLHKQMMTVLVDKMIKMKILEPAIVQAWIFSEEMKVEFKRSWVWDVLSSAVKATTTLSDNDEALRSVLLNICHKFTVILTEHILNCETDGTEVETNFYNFVTGRFKYVFLAHSESMWKFVDDLERELFSMPTIAQRIRQIFDQFISLKR